jgi:threonine dehydrogenase-like Zn-dependent dehydrogenase
VRAVTWPGKRDVRVGTVPDPVMEQPTDIIVRITDVQGTANGTVKELLQP